MDLHRKKSLPLKKKNWQIRTRHVSFCFLFPQFAYPLPILLNQRFLAKTTSQSLFLFKSLSTKKRNSSFKLHHHQLLCVTVCGSASLWNSKMGNVLRFLCGKGCNPTTDEDLESQGYHGVSAANVGVTALAHDLFHFEITSQVHMFSSGFNFFENWSCNPNVFELSDDQYFGKMIYSK